MENTTKEYQFEGTKGAWMRSEDISGFVRDENGQMHEIFQAFDGKDTSISNMDFGIAKENAKLICLAGNLAQKFDPETWETRLTQFEEMKTALERISNMEHCYDDASIYSWMESVIEIASEALASLTENNGNEKVSKNIPAYPEFKTDTYSEFNKSIKKALETKPIKKK